MTDTPMTPEEVVARIQEGRGVSYANLTYAAVSEYDRAERLAAENEKLRADARWLVRRTVRACKEAEGYLPDDPFTPWSIDVTAIVQEAADRLAAPKGS